MTAEKSIQLPADHLPTAAPAADNPAPKLFESGYSGAPGHSPTGLVGSETRGVDPAHTCLPNCAIEGANIAEPQGVWSRMEGNVSSAAHSIAQGAENIGTNIEYKAEDAGSFIKDKAFQSAQYVAEHPGYAAGALVGGVVAVVCSPVELTAAGVVGAGLLGAAALDGAAYLFQKELENVFGT